MKITEIKPNDRNPRYIKDAKFEKLCNSITEFPQMMALRPIVVDNDGVILGGNMRFRALKKLGWKDIPDEWVKRAEDLTEEQKRRFIVEDNVGFGEWDFDLLANEWNDVPLDDWGVDIPTFEDEQVDVKETEVLSDVDFNDVYYKPKNTPKFGLRDCINTDKYDAKIKAIDESSLNEAQKQILKTFAYRFIRIDFEMVANYYAFKATDEEKRIIERLRLVLVDGQLDGFIADDLLKIARNESEE